MTKLNLEDASLLKAALEGLELQRARLEEQIQKVRAMLSGAAPNLAAPEPATVAVAESDAGAAKRAGKKKKRRLSPEGRARIAEAQRKRWAAARKEQ
jgi:hypothetical protein